MLAEEGQFEVGEVSRRENGFGVGWLWLEMAADGRSPLVLTERRSHAETLAAALRGKVAHVVVLQSGQGANARLDALRRERKLSLHPDRWQPV
jgi:hypothetical protein